MVKFYDIIKNNLLLIAVMLWAVIFAIMAYPEPRDNKTIIQIEVDLDKIDGSLKNIEQTIEEIFGKLEIEINTGD
jgi:hypothetical protein|tara:strand:- start:923 stop:1147 length:225 start_codon:yes stop_codon:yes gene_type:complete